MRYVDTGTREADHALGSWLAREAAERVAALRWQTGFFGASGLGPLVDLLGRMAATRASVRAVIGSNGAETLAGDVVTLLDLMGMPRSHGGLAVVAFSNGLFHPKTFHFTRDDGTQAAYVGSANLGHAAVSGLHVEAGVLLDERDGDDAAELARIADAIDRWFEPGASGANVVADRTDVERLVEARLLARVRPPSLKRGGSVGKTPLRPSLAGLLALPPVLAGRATDVASGKGNAHAARSGGLGSRTQEGYPDYLRFTLEDRPTVGAEGLSGRSLPGGAVGLVARISKDSDRHWTNRTGTANISLPVSLVEALSFGLKATARSAGGVTPRAEYGFKGRFIGRRSVDGVNDDETSVVAYGFGAGGSSHRDVRMFIPKGAARALGQHAKRRMKRLPAAGDYVMLEWPDLADPTFRLSIVDPATPLYGDVLALIAAATQAGELLGGSGCPLPPGVSPPW